MLLKLAVVPVIPPLNVTKSEKDPDAPTILLKLAVVPVIPPSNVTKPE